MQLISDFIKDKKTEPSKLESHKKGCMCVGHLTHYKEKNIQILDKFINHKIVANYGRKISKSTSSINHGNLTTLT